MTGDTPEQKPDGAPSPGRRVALLAAAGVVLVGAGVGAFLGSGGGSGGAHRAAPTTAATGPPLTSASTSAPPTTAVPVSTPFTPADTAAWVDAENAQPGTADWKLTKPAAAHQIDGYADSVSVDEGSPLNLYVSTSAPSWTVQAFRMGYYGGAQGRLVWASPTYPGVVQPACPLQRPTNTTECAWTNPVPVDTTTWPQGAYLFKLQSSTGYQSYIPLTIRDDSSHSAFLVNDSVTTWEAYNTYGGYDLYQGPSGSLATRARAVSFDRPYVLGNGAGDFLGLELPMISMMESHGLDVSYTTDVDLSVNPNLVTQHHAFVALGHDEYYSLTMYQGLRVARDSGVSLMFLGANAVYRHIRLQPTALGPARLEIDYKDATADPLYGHDDHDVTPWAWRSPPNNAPESSLLGEMWECNPVRADMVITDPSQWVFDGTGLAAGARIPGIVGPEYDHFSAAVPNPGDVAVLAASPVNCNGRHSTADMTYYSAPSGAGVWDTGTIDWVGQILSSCATCAPPNPVTRITDNVLAAFGAGDPGQAHPSTPNAGGAPPPAPPGVTTTLPPGAANRSGD